ncbi:MAG: hypothetical protein H6Q72_4182 [Firmicutes bacterium]|nr:hypothetical protein [Bacillota bacterium]
MGVLAIVRKDNKLQGETQFTEDIAAEKAKYRKIVRAGIAKWISDFQKGLIEIKNVDDLKKLIELDLKLQREDP